MRRILAALILGLTLVGISFAVSKAEDTAIIKVGQYTYTYYYYNNYKAINELLSERHLKSICKKEVRANIKFKKELDQEKARIAHLSFYTRHIYTGKVYPIVFIEVDGNPYKLYEWGYKKSGRALYESSITEDEKYILQKAKEEGKI